jgi:hypothetical protein
MRDLKPTFLNYLQSVPGRDGVPLKYVCQDDAEPIPIAHDDFLDDYVSMAPLQSDSFAIDTAHVHAFLLNFVRKQPRQRFKACRDLIMAVKPTDTWLSITRASRSGHS